MKEKIKEWKGKLKNLGLGTGISRNFKVFSLTFLVLLAIALSFPRKINDKIEKKLGNHKHKIGWIIFFSMMVIVMATTDITENYVTTPTGTLTNLTSNKMLINNIYQADDNWDYSAGGSVYNRALFLNNTNYNQRDGILASTFYVGIESDIYNYGNDLKLTGVQTNIAQYSQNDTDADAAGFQADLRLYNGSNSTLKAVNIYLDDNANPSMGLRGINQMIVKDNDSSMAYGDLIQNGGNFPIDYGIYMTGGPGFMNGIYLDLPADTTGHSINGISVVGSQNTSLYLNQNTLGNVAQIENDGSGTALLVNQDGVLATNQWGLYVINDGTVQTTSQLMKVRDSKDSPKDMAVFQSASQTATNLFIDMDGNGTALKIDSESHSPPLQILSNASADEVICNSTYSGGIYFSDDNHFYGCNSTDWNVLDGGW